MTTNGPLLSREHSRHLTNEALANQQAPPGDSLAVSPTEESNDCRLVGGGSQYDNPEEMDAIERRRDEFVAGIQSERLIQRTSDASVG